MFQKLLTATAFILLSASATFAHDFKIGDLIVDHPVVRATAPGAKVSGGYLVIENTGDTDDRLIGGTVEFAKKTEIHEIKMEGDVMKMLALPDGLEIPAHATVKLEPGGHHLMFMKLEHPLKRGEKYVAKLKFEKAGEIDVTFEVKSIAATMKMKH